MKRRFLSLLCALAMLLSLLSGCGSGASAKFYTLTDELLAVDSGTIHLSVPYFGAQMQVDGTFSRTDRQADLTFTLSGTEQADGVWTQLKANGNDFWIDVAHPAQRALCFDLPSLRVADIEDLQDQQSADWMLFTSAGALWDGIPGWGTAFRALWENSKEELKSHISGSKDTYTLKVDGADLEKVLQPVVDSLVDDTQSYFEGFDEFTRMEPDLTRAMQLDPMNYFYSTWLGWTELQTRLDEGYNGSVELTLSKTESGSYVAQASVNGEAYSLEVIPGECERVQAPDSYMEFYEYSDYVYYMLSFSNTYMADALEGVDLSELMEHGLDEYDDTMPAPDPMNTGSTDYADVDTIRFNLQDDVDIIVPVPNSYTENYIASENDDGLRITDMNMNGKGWYLSMYPTPKEGMSAEYMLEQQIGSFYDAYISVSGYLLVQDLSLQTVSANGKVMAQGFVFRYNDRTEPVAEIMLLWPEGTSPNAGLMNLELNLGDMSKSDKLAIQHLFDYLELECPVDLNI